MGAEDIFARLGGRATWEQRRGSWWLEEPALSIEVVAAAMREGGARLATITARPWGGEYRLAYHWDAGGQLLTFVTMTSGGRTATITGPFPGADWIERELHDYYAIEFTGRESTPPLVLRAGDRPGIFRWAEEPSVGAGAGRPDGDATDVGAGLAPPSGMDTDAGRASPAPAHPTEVDAGPGLGAEGEGR